MKILNLLLGCINTRVLNYFVLIIILRYSFLNPALVIEQLVLIEPNPNKPYKVETNTSGFAIGGQLGQRNKEGRLHPIAFFS